jgi:hypothetical protein
MTSPLAKSIEVFSSDGAADNCNCGEPECVGHEVIETQTILGTEHIVQLPGFTSRKVRNRSPHLVVVFDDPIRPSLSWANECDLVIEVDENPDPSGFPYHWVLRG